MKKVLILFTALSCAAFADMNIADFQWKNRLLIVSKADGKMADALRNEKAGLDERDLRVFILGGSAAGEFPVEEGLAKEFRQRLSPPEDRPTVYLIGKDGKTSLSWRIEEFTFRKLYASIDAMPMRQREMKEGK